MMNKRWKLAELPPDFANVANVPKILLQILWNRGVLGFENPAEDAKRFLEPCYERDLYDPFLLKGVKEAVSKARKHIRNKSKICVYGDFDVDGVCGASIMFEIFSKYDADVFVYIPDREKEGYGVNGEAVKKILSQGAKLLVTVDCGITNKKELELAKLAKCDCIVIDHHEIQKDSVPNAVIVNPKQTGDEYPQKDLCAAALAWKVACAMFRSEISNMSRSRLDAELKWFLDLVGLATICDVVPLLGENRTLSYYGLKVLRVTRRIGLQQLYRVAMLQPERIGSYEVGFIIGPRLNAPGRIGSASVAYRLLVTKDFNEAARLAEEANNYNLKRQRILDEALEEAKAEVEARKLYEKKVLLLGSESWVGGIVGLLAGKLSQMFYRPTLVYERGPQISKGSARSIGAFHLVENLAACKEFLTRFGGHSKAAGFAFKNEDEEKFYRKLLELANEKISDEDLIPQLDIDAKATLKDFDLNLWDNYLSKLEPFGFGNPRPTFLIQNLQVVEKKLMGEDGKHVRFGIRDDEGMFGCVVGFDWGKQVAQVDVGKRVDIVVSADVNEWNNERRLEFRLLDLKLQS